MVFAPQRAFDERSDIFYYRVIQSVSKGLASHEVRLRYCALEENDSDAQLFLARMNEPDTQAAILLGIDDPHIHDLAVDVGKPCMLINCRDRHMRLPAVAPDHRAIGERAAEYLFEMGHREVMNVLCLRRYTMELRLSGIRDAWQSHNPGVQRQARSAGGAKLQRQRDGAAGERLAKSAAGKRPADGILGWRRLYGGGHHQRLKKPRPARAAGRLGDEHRRL